MWQKFKVFMGCLGSYLWMVTRLNQIWSKLYQLVWQRNKVMPLLRFATLERLVEYIKPLKWRPDTWREVGDATSKPEAIQWLAENEPNKLIGDCDEFGHYESAVVQNELKNGNQLYVRGWKVVQARLFTVMWYQTAPVEEVGFGGHNVCGLVLENGELCYMDYGHPSQSVKDWDSLAALVRHLYAPSCEKLGYAVSVPWSLKPEIVKFNG